MDKNYNHIQKLYQNLAEWFAKEQRNLPWRIKREPYQVWISEIMLQQTRVSTVINYYQNWMEQWPDVQSLALAKEDDVLKAWEGLGYYSRARNILKCAQIIMDSYNGHFPSSEKELMKLPGIGLYTAGAIASFAFGENTPAVDANVMRVISRIYSLPYQAGDAKSLKSCHQFLEKEMLILDDENNSSQSQNISNYSPATFNEALIEIGALICTAKNPKCNTCPLQDYCQAKQNNAIDSYPLAKKKNKVREEFYTVLVLFDQDTKTFAVKKRSAEGLLANLWEFPMLDGERSAEEITNLLEDDYLLEEVFTLDKIKHVFSHLIWNLQPYFLRIRSKDNLLNSSENTLILSEEEDSLIWLEENLLENLAFSSSMSGIRSFVREFLL